MKRLTDEELQQKIQKRKEELDSLLSMEKERIQARRSKPGAYLEERYGITTIQELESLLYETMKRCEE